LININNSIFQPDNEERFGESDGFTIWISRMKMSDEELVSDVHLLNIGSDVHMLS
jgi:hypothetical protein